MQKISEEVDAETAMKLRAQKINDQNLVLLNDADLVEMGIIEKGSRLTILNIIKNYSSEANPTKDKIDETSTNVQNLINRSTFEDDAKLRMKILYPILDQGIVPDKDGLNHLTRVACKQMETQIMDGQRQVESFICYSTSASNYEHSLKCDRMNCLH
ncbi:uncharacterized protein LOC131681122 [Topomyia yanbarensis]|uniref:uncharacterized protein LOC131681122 n=1 Tax=Topomyia yanbarensis TaxID=2498891 RepID=UPI00273A9E10|nr:uncharacterized protein LOC131681122 [Topomyia yanbarensis]